MKCTPHKISDDLHRLLKHAAFDAEGALKTRVTATVLGEVGILLVLADRGMVTTKKQATELGCSPLACVIFGRILAGENW